LVAQKLASKTTTKNQSCADDTLWARDRWGNDYLAGITQCPPMTQHLTMTLHNHFLPFTSITLDWSIYPL